MSKIDQYNQHVSQSFSTATLDTFSVERFNEALTVHGRKALGASFTWSADKELAVYFLRHPEALLDSPAPKALLRQADGDPERYQQACLQWLSELEPEEVQELLLDEITRALFERLAAEPPEQPLLQHVEQLSEVALEQGWSQPLQDLFSRIEAHLSDMRTQSDQLQVLPHEWTFESAVGDALLQTALDILEEGFHDLIGALQDADRRAARTSLEWLEEGFFTMNGVKEWAAKPWI